MVTKSLRLLYKVLGTVTTTWSYRCVDMTKCNTSGWVCRGWLRILNTSGLVWRVWLKFRVLSGRSHRPKEGKLFYFISGLIMYSEYSFAHLCCLTHYILWISLPCIFFCIICPECFTCFDIFQTYHICVPWLVCLWYIIFFLTSMNYMLLFLFFLQSC